MLRTRLWVGTLLVALAGGGLILDLYFAPYYPVLLILVLGLALAAGAELVDLLSGAWRLPFWVCQGGLILVVLANWAAHVPVTGRLGPAPWPWVAGAFAGFVLAAFVVEMATFREPGTSVARVALTV